MTLGLNQPVAGLLRTLGQICHQAVPAGLRQALLCTTVLSISMLVSAPLFADGGADWQPTPLSLTIGDSAGQRWIASVDGDEIGLNLLQHNRPDHSTRAVVLHLPGTHMNGQSQFQIDDQAHNLWLYLANRGIDVYSLDYRSHFIDTDEDELSAMAGWTMETYATDALRALRWVQARHPDAPLFLAGFSRGAGLAYGTSCLAAEAGIDLTGLLALDGGFKRPDNDDVLDIDAAREAWQAGEDWALDIGGSRGWLARQALMQSVLDDAPDARETLQDVLYNAWGPGVLANPDTLSDTAALAALMITYDRYYPSVQNLDARALAATADAEHSSLDDCWGSMQIPVMAVIAGRFAALQPGGRYSAEASGSDDVSVLMLDDYGHLDILVGREAPDRVFTPILNWIKERTDH